METAKIYLVSTPIGNLSDMTYRAIETLNMVEVIYAEDTRETKKLLNHYAIDTPLKSYHQHNELFKVDAIIEQVKNGSSVAVVSDAGTPRLSDPGDALIEKAYEAGVDVSPIPGASALLSALVSSPFRMDEFTFIGFIPMQNKAKNRLFNRLKEAPGTLVFYEAPHRINATLKDLARGLGPRLAYLGRELTKKFEEHQLITLDASFILPEPRGEYVIIVKGNETPIELDDDYINHIDILMADGLSEKDAIKKVANDRNLKKNTVYMAYQAYKKEGNDAKD